MNGTSLYDFVETYLNTEFECVKLLHSGERGAVRLMRRSGSGNLYIARSFTGSCEVYARLLSISCPNLPRIYEAAEKDGKVLVLEEYIQGDTVFGLLKGSLFNAAETRNIALGICRALCVLHGFGAVHRDIKPENVIIRGEEAVLIDFDASRTVKTGGTTDTVVLGTTGYAAPEQYGIGQTDARADIYALGVLMNVMMTGKHPSIELAPGRLGRVIKKCIMVNPDHRYKDVVHLMEVL